MLHNDKKRFIQLVTAVSDAGGIDKALIEKDYFVTLFLERLKEREPLLVFKGGTCLSKCFKLFPGHPATAKCATEAPHSRNRDAVSMSRPDRWLPSSLRGTWAERKESY